MSDSLVYKFLKTMEPGELVAISGYKSSTGEESECRIIVGEDYLDLITKAMMIVGPKTYSDYCKSCTDRPIGTEDEFIMAKSEVMESLHKSTLGNHKRKSNLVSLSDQGFVNGLQINTAKNTFILSGTLFMKKVFKESMKTMKKSSNKIRIKKWLHEDTVKCDGIKGYIRFSLEPGKFSKLFIGKKFLSSDKFIV